MVGSGRIRTWWRWLRRLLLVGIALLVLVVGLFVWNGLSESWRTPTHDVLAPEVALEGKTLRVLALNLAKVGFHRGGLDFADEETVTAQLDQVVTLLAAEDADLVFLSEVVHECGPVNVDQARYLAERARYAHVIRSDNKSFGLPFFRIRAGNALLSRLPVRPLACVQLAGAKPFWKPTNNRRALFAETTLSGEAIVLASLRNDSFSLANNAVHMEEILAWIGERPAILAGDFNADAETPQILALKDSGRWTGTFDGAPTFPLPAPRRTIDYVLAPARFRLEEARVVDSGVSDHLAVVATFRLP